MDWRLLLNSWLPFLIIIGVWLFFVRKIRPNYRDAMKMNEEILQIAKDQVAENRRANILLEEIKTLLQNSAEDDRKK